MIKKILLILLSVLLFSSCSDKKEKVLHTYLSGVLNSLDPMLVTDRYSHTVTRQVYEGLYQYHYLKRPYTLEPVIAKSMPEVSKDGLTYTVELKQNIYFVDDQCFIKTNGKGRKLTAEDVIYSFTRAMDSKKTQGILFSDLMRKDIESISKKGDYTIVFKLKHRTPFFPDVLSRPNGFIVAQEAVEYYGDDFGSHPVGTGPFILKDYDKNKKIVLVKNPKYSASVYPSVGSFNDKEKGLLDDTGKKLPFLDKIVIYVLPDEAPRWMNFLKGVVDIVVPDKDTYYDAFPVAGELSAKLMSLDIKVSKMLNLETYFFVFNLKKGYLVKNKKLRQAISLAFDTEKYNALFHNNQVILANWIIPPNIFAYDADSKNPYMGKNIKKAKKLLIESGINPKQMKPLRVLVRDSITGKQMGEFFARSMESLGLKVELIQKEFGKIMTQLPTWEGYDVAFLRWRVDFPNVEDPLRLLYSEAASPGPNRSGYENKEYDKLYNQISITKDGLSKFALIKKARMIAREDVPLVPLFHPILITLYHGYLENYKPHLLVGDMYKYVDINLNAKKRILKKLLD